MMTCGWSSLSYWGVVRNRTSVDLKTDHVWGLEWLSISYHIVAVSASSLSVLT